MANGYPDLFGFASPEDKQQAAYAGLLGLASGLLQGGAPSPVPGGFARGLGAGLGGFNQGYQGYLSNALKDNLYALQARKMKGDVTAMEDFRQRYAQMTGGAPTGKPKADAYAPITPSDPTQPGALGMAARMNATSPDMIATESAPQIQQSPGKRAAAQLMTIANALMPVNPTEAGTLMEKAFTLDPDLKAEAHAANQGLVRGPNGAYASPQGYDTAMAGREGLIAGSKAQAESPFKTQTIQQGGSIVAPFGGQNGAPRTIYQDQRYAPGSVETDLGKNLNDLVIKDVLKTGYDTATQAVRGNDSLAIARVMLDKGIFSGPFADVRKEVGRLLYQGGLAKDDSAANTETFFTQMGTQVLSTVKQLGSGVSISNADREYAEKIAGGQIKLTEDSLRRIVDIGQRVNDLAIKNHNNKVDELGKVPGASGEVLKLLKVTPNAPPDFSWMKKSETAPALPMPTLRWNPKTNKLEPM